MILLKLCAAVVAVGMAATAFTTSHIVHAGHYDPYHHDYHPVRSEINFYRQWEVETHRDRMDFSKRNIPESSDYWNWRHSQPAQNRAAPASAIGQLQ